MTPLLYRLGYSAATPCACLLGWRHTRDRVWPGASARRERRSLATGTDSQAASDLLGDKFPPRPTRSRLGSGRWQVSHTKYAIEQVTEPWQGPCGHPRRRSISDRVLCRPRLLVAGFPCTSVIPAGPVPAKPVPAKAGSVNPLCQALRVSRPSPIYRMDVLACDRSV